jgi:DNA-binding NtrC family response regulator
LAEDEQSIATVLLDMLAEEGFSVRHAWDGTVALAMIEHDPPDLLISNVKMPRVDGVQLMRHATKRIPPIPVILISAHFDGADVPGAVFVAKPFDLDHIVALVDRLLNGG